MDSICFDRLSLKARILICSIAIFGFCLKVSAAAIDTNPVFSPCGPSAEIQRGDGFTFAIAFGAESRSWGNVSLCDAESFASLPTGIQMAVFRPRVDELALIRINNVSMANIETTFPESSLVVYSGENGSVSSVPRLFLSEEGRVPSLILILNFLQGVLSEFLWKDFGCGTSSGCDSSSLCFDGVNCALPTSQCGLSSDPDACRLAIYVAFSGTDKHDAVLSSYLEVQEIDNYSLTDLYKSASTEVINNAGIDEDNVDQITQG